MGYIVDLSHHQPSSAINWDEFHKNLDFIFARVQYGSLVYDEEYKNHIANAKKYNIPYHTYAFICAINENDARVEARDAFSRMDKNSLSIALDIETDYQKGKAHGLTALSHDGRLAAIKAYVDELHKLGVNKIGAYVAHNVYKSWGIDTIIDLFQYSWIPRYPLVDNGTAKGPRPAYPCDLWQYSSKGRLPGFGSNLDLSLLTGRKPLSYFTGIEVAPKKNTVKVPVQPVTHKVSTVLQQGDKGDAVLQMQKLLAQAYFYPDKGAKNNGIDGDFGPKTIDAVKRFQLVHKLTADGIYGPATKAALEAAVTAQKATVKQAKAPVKKAATVVKQVTKKVVAKVTKEKAPASYYITYTVKKGDTLSEIGKSHKVDYRLIKKANKLNSDDIFPGEKLKIPAKSRPTYEVKAGDTLWEVSQAKGVTVTKLKALNHLKNDTIFPGQKLYLK